MPAPKRANTAPATAALRRKAQERKASELTRLGWLVIPPEAAVEAAVLLTCDTVRVWSAEGGAP